MKPANAVCQWCEHFDNKHKDCDARGGITILEPWKPRRCARYEGILVNAKSLRSLKEVGL